MACRARPGGAREFRQGRGRLEPGLPARRGRGAAGLDAVPAPPTFTFAAPYWGAFRADEQPADPTGGAGNPMHTIMGDLFAQGALVLHGEQEFVYHRTPVAGDVLDGVQSITDIYEKETDTARHDVRRHGDGVDRRRRRREPVVTERFNLIARLKK